VKDCRIVEATEFNYFGKKYDDVGGILIQFQITDFTMKKTLKNKILKNTQVKLC